jgi:hypothetical protein
VISLSSHVAVAQTATDQKLLSLNCSAVGIGQCYHDGWIRFINSTFLPQINSVLIERDKDTLKGIKFIITDDPNALGAGADYQNGSMYIRITSSVGYHIALFANAGVLALSVGKDLTTFLQYQEKVVTVLLENTRRARLGEPLLPTPSYAEAMGIDQEKATELMNNPAALGLNAYFTQMIMFWVLAHETGHQLLGHAREIARNPNAARKPMEQAADEFASRTMVKMGYSVYPTIFLLGYFAAVEAAGARDPADYPPAVCRLANVFKAAYAERAGGRVAPRDAANKTWNDVMDQPNLKQMIWSISGGAQCRGS